MQHKNNIQVNTPRVMFAATRSGSGKTTVTCGVLAALKKHTVIVATATVSTAESSAATATAQ